MGKVVFDEAQKEEMREGVVWISSVCVGWREWGEHGSASAKALRCCVSKSSKEATVQYASKKSKMSRGPDCGPVVIEMTDFCFECEGKPLGGFEQMSE